MVCSHLVVFFQDECHLLCVEVGGSIWGRTDEGISVLIVNQGILHTYYGAVKLSTEQCLIQPYEAGKSENTIAFIYYLRSPMS
ncbi:hypothetical protein [Microcoleus sp. BROC3]|uniref:hypothetical protein n=1 Tax=Microcoleus sp. BROC3 TaxID=3055323 RepID=UPI002FD0C768